MVDMASIPCGNTIGADPPGGAVLRLENLAVDFRRNAVLRDINLSIQRGQTVAIIGESGCGKTVLLKAILGLLRPSRGKVFFAGRDLADMDERQLNEERIRFGFLFQQAALFDSLTVAENVAFPLRQHTAAGPAEIRQVVLSRLAEVGLPAGVLGQRPAELSGGMRKRVGLARALALEPEVMLYDEPTTGLDPIMADVINELILSTRRHHPVTSVVVTHDMRTARKVADRVVMIYPLGRLDKDEPQIIYDGPPQNLDGAAERRVRQFVRGEAGERLRETRAESGG
jgi:phospholipid/cholesterol/gamma-HCH transport system ATP-binding protein